MQSAEARSGRSDTLRPSSDRVRRVLAASCQLAFVAGVFVVGSRCVVGSLKNGGHVHVVLGLAGSRARLIELTNGVSPGFSGAAVVNSWGELVGLLEGQLDPESQAGVSASERIPAGMRSCCRSRV